MRRGVRAVFLSLVFAAGSASAASITPPDVELPSQNLLINTPTAVTITVANFNSIALTGIGFVVHLPAGLAVSASPNIVGNCFGGTVTALPGASSFSLSNGTLAGFRNCIFDVDLTGRR